MCMRVSSLQYIDLTVRERIRYKHIVRLAMLRLSEQ